ncbi:MAG: transposase [Clostridia bacterium]|nr:transposase [Clostridia bacterium]
MLKYSTTNRDGYREYKSNPEICKNCPTRELCTQSKDCVKVVTRHIWKDYEELAEDIRHTPKYQDLYKLRKAKWNSNEKASLFHKIKLIFALAQKNPCFA